jgi:hypothetical protein
MDDLTLVGVHEDGEHLLLVDGSGSRHRLKVDEALRAAVRRDRARLGQLQLESEGRLRPREIQARIRAGESAEEVAAAAGVPIEHVRRYEGPVLAEREFVASQARGVRVRRGTPGTPGASGGTVTGAATLGEVVADRLTQREVEPDDATWDAWRAEDGSWSVVVTFTAGAKQREARWTYDPSLRHVSPLDDEARWLTEDEPPQPQRRLSPVRDRRYDVEASGATRPVPEDSGAVDLLDTLAQRRGRRTRPAADADPNAIDPVREAIDSLMSRGELRARGDRPDPAPVAPPERPERVERTERPERPEPKRPAKPVARVEAPQLPVDETDEPAEPAEPPEKPAARTSKRTPSRPETRRGATKRQEPKRPAGRRAAGTRAPAEPAAAPDDPAADPPPAHPARSRPQDARDGEVLVLPDAEPDPAPVPAEAHDDEGDPSHANGAAVAAAGAQRRPAASPSGRKQRRASVPSWDDIVFGQRRD